MLLNSIKYEKITYSLYTYFRICLHKQNGQQEGQIETERTEQGEGI